MKAAEKTNTHDVILVNLSGRGDRTSRTPPPRLSEWK